MWDVFNEKGNIMFRTSLLLVGILTTSLLAHAQGFEFNQSLNCNWIEPIQTGYLQNHLVFKAKDKELQNRVIEQYIKRIDPLKIYLVQADIQKVKDVMKDVFVNVEKKDCKFMTEIQELIVKRVDERTAFVKKFLGKDFKFNKETEFVYDPDHKNNPKNTEEAEEFIKNTCNFRWQIT